MQIKAEPVKIIKACSPVGKVGRCVASLFLATDFAFAFDDDFFFVTHDSSTSIADRMTELRNTQIFDATGSSGS